jgi:hypothetical protein
MSRHATLLVWLNLVCEAATVPTFKHDSIAVTLNEPVENGTRVAELELKATATADVDAVLHYSIVEYKQRLPRHFGVTGYQYPAAGYWKDLFR